MPENSDHPVPDLTVPSHAVPALAVTCHPVPGLAMSNLSNHATSTYSETDSAVIVNKVAKVTDHSIMVMIDMERKKMLRASQLLQLMWKVFLVRQLKLFLSVVSMTREADSVDHYSHSKCLNNTSRALCLKLKAASLLASAGLCTTWSPSSVSCQHEETLAEIPLSDNFKRSEFQAC